MTACTFMQVINILCNNSYIKKILQLSYQLMPPVRLDCKQLFTAFIIKIYYQLRVSSISFGSSYLFYRITIPQPPESRNVLMPLSALIPAPVSITSFFIGRYFLFILYTVTKIRIFNRSKSLIFKEKRYLCRAFKEYYTLINIITWTNSVTPLVWV